MHVKIYSATKNKEHSKQQNYSTHTKISVSEERADKWQTNVNSYIEIGIN